MTWNSEYESEYESVSRISVWINFHRKIWYIKLNNTTTNPYVLFQTAIRLLKDKRNYKI